MDKPNLLLGTILIGFPLLASANIGDITSSNFINSSTLDLGMHNIWRYLDEGEVGQRNIHSAWGQGFSLDYKTGYLADIIGVDASYYGVVKLAAAESFASRGVLYDDRGEAKGFNKIGQIYGKAKFSQSGIDGNLYGGWKLLKLGALATSMRAAPNTYQGWSGDLNYDIYRLRMAYVTRSSNRDSPDQVHFLTSDRKTINAIYTGDLQLKTDQLTGLYFYGESENYLRRNGLELDIKQNKALSYGVQIYLTNALQQWNNMAETKKDFDSHAGHYAADMTWTKNNWTTKTGVSYTNAGKEDGIGKYTRHMSKNSRGRFNSMANAGFEYMHDKEKALALDIGYKLTPEFTLGVNTHFGLFNYQGQSVNEGEFNIYSLWQPSSKALKDLTIFAMMGPGRTFEHRGTTPIVDQNGNIKHTGTFSAELRVDYRFKLF